MLCRRKKTKNPNSTKSLLFAEISGCFELFQSFQTNDGAAVVSFELDNELFITFANYPGNFGSYKTKLPVYLPQKNNFKLNQTLDSSSVWDVEYFTVHDNHFLVVANRYKRFNDSLDRTVVYRYEAGKFNEFQRIPMNRVTDTHTTSPSTGGSLYRLVIMWTAV